MAHTKQRVQHRWMMIITCGRVDLHVSGSHSHPPSHAADMAIWRRTEHQTALKQKAAPVLDCIRRLATTTTARLEACMCIRAVRILRAITSQLVLCPILRGVRHLLSNNNGYMSGSLCTVQGGVQTVTGPDLTASA